MVLALPFHMLSINQSILWTGLQQVIVYLQAPILVYHDHDGDQDVDLMVEKFSLSHSLFIAKTPELPDSESLALVKPLSTVLRLRNPDTVSINLRRWNLWNAHGKILVILDDPKNTHEWIMRLWQTSRAVDVLVMVLNDSIPSFFTWFPYAKIECLNVTKITRLEPPNFFPPKIVPPLNGCPLRAVTTALPPLVVNNNLGIEPRLFHALAQKLGLQPEFVSLPEGVYIWTLYSDEVEPVNAMKMLWENEIDMMFSCLTAGTALQFADYLPSHFQDYMKWFVPGPKLASKATSILRAFDSELWFFVIASWISILATLLVTALVYGSPIRPLFLNALAINLNLPSRLVKSQRFLVFIALGYIYSMHITAMYQSSLIIFLSDASREKPIKTLQDLEAADEDIELHELYKDLAADLVATAAYSKILRPEKLSFTNFLQLQRIIDSGKLAIIGSETSFGFEILNDEKTYYDNGFPRILILQPVIVTADIAFLISKGHPLLPIMSDYVLRLVAAGLPQYYQGEVMKPPPKFYRKIEAFGMDEIEGPFKLFLILLLLSVLAWTAELMFYYCYQKPFYQNCKNGLRLQKTALIRLEKLVNRK